MKTKRVIAVAAMTALAVAAIAPGVSSAKYGDPLVKCDMPVEHEDGVTRIDRVAVDADTCYKYGGQVMGPYIASRKSCGTVATDVLRYPATITVKAQGTTCGRARQIARAAAAGRSRAYGWHGEAMSDHVSDDVGQCFDVPGGCDVGQVEYSWAATWRKGNASVRLTAALD